MIFFQVKATDHLPLLKGGRTVSWSISRRDLKLWLTEVYPVILVVYDAGRNIAYWLHVQDFFDGFPTSKLFAGGDRLNVHIPVANRVNRWSLLKLARRKNELQREIIGRTYHRV